MLRIIVCFTAGLVTFLILLVYFLIAWAIGSEVWTGIFLAIIFITSLSFYYLLAKTIEKELDRLDEMEGK